MLTEPAPFPTHAARRRGRVRIAQVSGSVTVRLPGTYILRWENVEASTKCAISYVVR